jgi:hypothetical protein
MQNLRLPLFCLSIIVFNVTKTQAQSSPSSLNPGYTNSSALEKHTKKKKIHFFSPRREKAYRKPDVKHTARYEFYERVEKAAKEKQRILKELSKPQYSDFKHFGHKRIPKKRPPHRMRYCGECGIRH